MNKDNIGNMAHIKKISQGHYLLKGVLNFKSVPELWDKNKTSLFSDQSKSLSIDCLQLEHSDSSGLALLLEWYRAAQVQNIDIVFYNLPQQMYDIAKISGLDTILPLKLKQN